MRESLGELNIQHITLSPYNPQSNAKVETLADVLVKLVEHNRGNWDLFLTQVLAAVRFSMNETTKFSLYYLVYGRDVVLPLDNLLRPRRKYLGEDHHRIVEPIDPASFIIWDQLTGKVRRVHANDIKLAEIEEWKVGGMATKQKKLRSAILVEPKLLESNSEASEEIEISPTTL